MAKRRRKMNTNMKRKREGEGIKRKRICKQYEEGKKGMNQKLVRRDKLVEK